MDEKKFDVVAEFGVDVFNEETMQQRLPKNVFKALKKTMTEGKELDSSIADIVANAMKDSCFSAVMPVIGWNQWV